MDHRSPGSVAACRSRIVIRRSAGHAVTSDMAGPLWSPPPSGWRHLRSSHPSAASRKYLPGGRRRDRYGLGMDSANYLEHLRRGLAAFEACRAADLSARGEHCADRTLYDLAGHLGPENLWAAPAVAQQP